MNVKYRFICLYFLEFAVWGAYLTSMGAYLAKNGMAGQIGLFYSVQGFISLFLPALMGIVADRWVQAQRLLSFCHLMAGMFMILVCSYGYMEGDNMSFSVLFPLYACSVVFFMPTISLSNSVTYSVLDRFGVDVVKSFPSIRIWGTIGFVFSMWIVDLGRMQTSPFQFGWSGVLSLILATYALSIPSCPTVRTKNFKSFTEATGLRAFALFRNSRMAIFFVFCILVGVCNQITNGFANPFISSFGRVEEFADSFGVRHTNILISLSQISEAFCILLIPFCLKQFGIKRVILIAILSWMLRFLFFALGDPGDGVWFFVLSMLVYGIAFDFFSISGSLFVNKETDASMRSSAQGLFMMMTSGFGATIGMLMAQKVVNKYVNALSSIATGQEIIQGWNSCWYIFACYALCVAVAFAILFRYEHKLE